MRMGSSTWELNYDSLLLSDMFKAIRICDSFREVYISTMKELHLLWFCCVYVALTIKTNINKENKNFGWNIITLCYNIKALMKLGHSQAERHQTLTLALPGSNPGGPANKKSTHLLVGFLILLKTSCQIFADYLKNCINSYIYPYC